MPDFALDCLIPSIFSVAQSERLWRRGKSDIALSVRSYSTRLSPEGEVYNKTLPKAGVPAAYIGMFSSFAEAIKQGEFESVKSDLENLLGRKPVSLREYLAQTYTVGK